jgi:hypothetical protein
MSKKTNSHKRSRSQKGGIYPFDSTTSTTDSYTTSLPSTTITTSTLSEEKKGGNSVALAVSFVVGGIVGFVSTYVLK